MEFSGWFSHVLQVLLQSSPLQDLSLTVSQWVLSFSGRDNVAIPFVDEDSSNSYFPHFDEISVS